MHCIRPSDTDATAPSYRRAVPTWSQMTYLKWIIAGEYEATNSTLNGHKV